MRARWYDESTCYTRREAMRREARARLEKAIGLTSTPTINGIHLKRGCDLRASLEEKALDCSTFAKWTAFVNRAGTLCHLVPKEGDIHIRIPLYYSTLSLTDNKLKAMLWSHLEGRVR